ncbi:MAG: MCP four helix bundle domain-containing protein, partial [Thermodesulfobacteriota bacterium]|nr:MCP four helix bundle domain-containing protein [Thermodesulfobacteriota bacterium]
MSKLKIFHSKILKMNLRKKTLAGYIAVIVLIIFIGAISITQFTSLKNKTEYLTEDVAAKVQLAGEIESAILSMRISVEKFIYKNREEDNIAAGEDIKRVLKVLENADKQIKDVKEAAILKKIKGLTNEYIEKYKNVVIRFKARGDSKSELSSMGNKIQEELEKLSIGDNNKEIADISVDSHKAFLSARINMESYFLDYNYIYSSKAKEILSGILTDMEEVNIKELEDTIFSIEDYIDAFEGLISVVKKMDKEIKDTVLPLAPKIVNLAKEISASGREEMNNAGIDVERKVGNTKNVILTIVAFTIFLGLGIGFLSANQIVKPISKVVAGLKDIAEGEGDLT